MLHILPHRAYQPDVLHPEPQKVPHHSRLSYMDYPLCAHISLSSPAVSVCHHGTPQAHTSAHPPAPREQQIRRPSIYHGHTHCHAPVLYPPVCLAVSILPFSLQVSDSSLNTSRKALSDYHNRVVRCHPHLSAHT